ncbi:MAG: hypothetical protein UZ14_CFX002000473 [Chloroflexi bacterium OLB14]|nr:MAG: hypothetical protein UZ14_CFX002000473 [Chloroflexi bacterium OLB14]
MQKFITHKYWLMKVKQTMNKKLFLHRRDHEEHRENFLRISVNSVPSVVNALLGGAL